MKIGAPVSFSRSPFLRHECLLVVLGSGYESQAFFRSFDTCGIRTHVVRLRSDGFDHCFFELAKQFLRYCTCEPYVNIP